MRDATNYIKQLQDRRVVVSGLAAPRPLNFLSSSRTDNWEQAGVVMEVWKCEPSDPASGGAPAAFHAETSHQSDRGAPFLPHFLKVLSDLAGGGRKPAAQHSASLRFFFP